MNLRKVAILLITSLSFATVLPGFSADFQQVELKGPKNSTEEFSGTVYGPIDSSDTLWRIADRYRQNKNLTIYQVMLAIYKLNPTAFEENNLNLLKDGSTLRLPSERYIARINKAEALAKSQQDEVLWQAKLPPGSLDLINNLKPAEKLASKTDLDQTKQVLEQRLGALDEEQNRQFMAIRQQFAESINSVQAILNENQKLFERLDSVNTDLSDLRASEAEREQQIGQMGLSIDELLKKSRKEDEQRKAEVGDNAGSDWLRDPITLIILTLFLSLTLLAGFGYWLVGRKRQDKLQGELAEFANEPPPIPKSTELDDLSDALSDELSEELDKDLDDDDLFGEDDFQDDVLSQELEDSLDDSIESELEDFDDFGDEMLVPDESAGETDFESDSETIEQDDLDSLFEDDNDLLAEIDEDIDSIDLSDTEKEDDPIDLSETDHGDDSIDLSETDQEDDSIDLSETDQDDDSFDLSETAQEDDTVEAEIYENEDIEEFDKDGVFDESAEIEDPTESNLDEQYVEQVSDNLPKINDEPEKPEISIDELFDEPTTGVPDVVDVDEPEQINEEMLQQLGKEITSQSEELDDITDTLLDELEQAEQLRSMLPEEDEYDETEISNVSDSEQQHDIQELDELTDVFDDELVSDELGDDSVEGTGDELALDAELTSSEEAKVDADFEIEAEARVGAETETDTEAAVDEEPEIESEAAVDEEPEIESEAAVDEEPEIESEAAVVEEPEIESEAAVVEEPEIESEAAVDEESEIESEAEVDEESEKDAEGNDDSELDKALEDFEDISTDEAGRNLSDNDEEEVPALDSSLDDLELAKMPEDNAESETSEQESTDAPSTIKPLPDLDDIGSFTDFDDAELEQAFQEIDSTEDPLDKQPNNRSESENKDLEDVPGLGDWLSDSDAKEDLDKVLLDELENSSFDELLETIDIDEGDEFEEEEDDSDLDIEALLSEELVDEPSNKEKNLEETDFLDVEALLTESIDAEPNPLSEKNLDLDSAFGEFSGVTDDSDSVDVDGDKGVGAKLDLAQAYIEIGEIDSARELLEEIIANGNPEQIEEAQAALSTLG